MSLGVFAEAPVFVVAKMGGESDMPGSDWLGATLQELTDATICLSINDSLYLPFASRFNKRRNI